MSLNWICTQLLGLLALLTANAASAGWRDIVGGPPSLIEVEDHVEQDFPSVRQLKGDNLAEQLRTGRPMIILDVREPEEFEVSHLPDARLIRPGASLEEVRQVVGPMREGVLIVMYCSVGYRSSKLADRVQKDLLADGAASVENLRGGIFGWSNDGRPLVNALGSTKKVHPYDSHWGRLLKPTVGTAEDTRLQQP